MVIKPILRWNRLLNKLIFILARIFTKRSLKNERTTTAVGLPQLRYLLEAKLFVVRFACFLRLVQSGLITFLKHNI